MKSLLSFFGHGGKQHDCQEIVSKLGELIDGEVDEQMEQQLIKEIKRCPACLKHYDLDKSFKDFLKTRVERKCCAEKVKADILQKIRAIEEG